MKAERIAELIVPDDGDRLMSMRETAARLLTSPATVTALTRRGVLRGVHIGHNIGYSKRHVDELIERLTASGTDVLVLAGRKEAEGDEAAG